MRLKSLQEQIKENAEKKMKQEGAKFSLSGNKDPKNENLGSLLSKICFENEQNNKFFL